MSPNQKILNKTKGCIIGLAIGDALGMPTEFVARRQFKKEFGGQVRKFESAFDASPCPWLKAGQYTDDTQQMLLLVKTLTNKGYLDMDEFSAHLKEWGKRCMTEEHYDRYSGTISMGAARKMLDGEEWTESGNPIADSCGAAMRVAPVGAFYKKLEKAMERARMSAMPTHRSQASMDGAALVAGIVNRLVFMNMNPQEAVEEVAVLIEGKVMKEKLKLVFRLQNENPSTAAAEIGTDGSASSTVGYALWCFLHDSRRFESPLLIAANVDNGDSDSIAAMAGAMSGALHGYDRIPEHLLKVENAEYLLMLAEQMANTAQKANYS